MIAVWRRLTTTTKIQAEYGGFTSSPEPGTDPTIVASGRREPRDHVEHREGQVPRARQPRGPEGSTEAVAEPAPLGDRDHGREGEHPHREDEDRQLEDAGRALRLRTPRRSAT